MRLLPRQEEFFDLFVEVATRSHEAAKHMLELFTGPLDRREYHVDAIKRLEHEADEVTHEVVRRLDRTFITPIDREDIHLLASDLDDVVDRIDSTVRRAQIFRVGATQEGIKELCELIVQITAEMAKAVEKLRGRDDVIKHCIEAKRLEEEGDAVYHTMLGRMFERESDPIVIIKWKEMFDNLEAALDDCEDVANDLQSIVLKNA
ncbi:MAG: DUF47 domain-containing protein [Gemmatimonadota bacterium]|nr:MAG: hypothetical protein AMS20_14425 [Gemmatimonas sp. SG8_28]UCF42023.1 MAG: DUF47 domain-containing protein [Gemmatimonadota bacterium]